MRCPSCNKMVSYGDPEVEVQNEDFDPESNFASGEVRIMLPCADCGTELKEAVLDWEVDFTDKHPSCKNDKAEEASIEVEAEAIDRSQTMDGKGKPIPSRFQKHFFGAEITVTLTCGKCGEEITESVEVEEQASAFEELV